MACVDYNIIKEGVMYNATISGSLLFSDLQLQSLYDGNYDTPSITISGVGGIIGVHQNFGESYDVCYVRYYTDEPLLSNIEGTYSTFSGTEAEATWYLESSGVYRADINTQLRNLFVTHTISSGINTNIYQLEMVAEENDTLGFGNSSSEDIDYFMATHATNKALSSSPNVVTIFNDNHFDEVAKVAVAPTFSEEDKYVFISTTKSGTYYGIDDFGVSQPGHKKCKLVTDPLSSGTLSNQWYLRTPPATHLVTRNEEGISFEIGNARFAPGVNTRRASGLLSAEEFTVQSFTSTVKVKLDSYTPYLDSGSAVSSRTMMFILTNGFAIPDVGYNGSQTTRDRIGGVSIGLVMCANSRDASKSFSKDSVAYRVRLSDGEYLEHRSGSIEGGFINFLGVGSSSNTYGVQVSGPSLSEFENINYKGEDFGDYTSLSNWREWRIVYDHIKRELKGYVDNIYIGSVTIKSGNLSDGTRLFIGQHGDSNQSWSFKDFGIIYDSLYYQDEVAAESTITATISGSEVYKIADDSTTPYVGPNPNANSSIRVTFDSPKDVAYYTIKQRDKDTATSAYGLSYYPDVVRAALIDFGGKFTQVHNYPNSNSIVQRAPTYSGTAVVASGIDYIDFNFILYDDTEYDNGALVIEEMQIFSENNKSQTINTPEEETSLIPWSDGVFHNIKIYGEDKALSLRDKAKRVMIEPLPEYAVDGVNFGFSSQAMAREHAQNPVDGYGYGVEVLYPTYHQDGGDDQEGGQHAWFSGPNKAYPIYAWQVFDEESVITSVYWNSSNFWVSRVVADKFKFQYLVDGGSPLNESDWINFPPVSIPHPYSSEISESNKAYQEYKDYLISNNDGEYYTSYYDLPNTTASTHAFSIGGSSSLQPKDMPIPASYMSSESPTVRLIDANTSNDTNGTTGFIHFDSPISTRGVRMVVQISKRVGTGAVVQEFGLSDIYIFKKYSTGSYTSPVFDTGTKQNTERLNVKADIRDSTHIRTFVRSSEHPPLYKYNSKYEFWESSGEPGNSQVEVIPPNTNFSVGSKTSLGVQVIGNIAYLFLSKPYAYNITNDTWTILAGGYPSSASSATTMAANAVGEGESSTATAHTVDSSVGPLTALIGSNIYIAAKTVGNASVPRLMYYDTIRDTWNFISGNRPPFAEGCSMVASSSQEDLFFFNRDGTISSYNISTSVWIEETVSAPRVGDKRCIVQVGGKIYVFGGEDGSKVGSFAIGSNICWVFDESTKLTSYIAPSPYSIYRGNAILVEEHKCIYVLPFVNASGSNDTPMKYFYEEDRWETVESLLSFREAGYDPGNPGVNAIYYKQGDYIYGIGDFASRKTLVVNEAWTVNKSPSFKDPIWGSKEGLKIPWREIGSFGEFMPQERYFQFKSELQSFDLKNSPVLKSVTVVQPQSILVPASGTSNIYVKLGAFTEKTYDMWYSAYDSYSSAVPLSMMYSSSNEGVGWSYGTTVSGAWNSASPGNFPKYHTTTSMWAIKNEDSTYEHWFSAQEEASTSDLDEGFYIRYSSSTQPDYISGNTTAISGTELAESQNGALHPCVIKSSPSIYDMWYTGIDGSDIKRIVHAGSSDGISWSSHSLVLDIGSDINSHDSDHAYRPSVIKEGSVYKMWYTGIDSESVGRILYTESSDGLSWGDILTVVSPGDMGEETSQSVTDAVVAYDGTQYVMMYIGTDGIANYGIKATSPDGLEWLNHIISIPAGGISESVDSSGPKSIYFLVDVNNVEPSTVYSSAKLKIHNDGAAL
jgi:(2Fe-2S) ferredoxin